MANFCSQCGSPVNDSMTFCPTCGAALHKSAAATNAAHTDTSANDNAKTQSSGLDGGSVAVGAIGTLVAVTLLGGLTRQLYFRGGRYYLDPYCLRPFANPHLILGRRLLRPPMPRPPMFPHFPMGGFRGPFGGPRPPMGGPRGPFGGPRGRR